jgi:cyclase
MCKVNRREFLAKSTAFLGVAAEAEILQGAVPGAVSETVKVEQLAPDVYFHEGIADPDHAAAVCNNGWILFSDYVLVIDANYPAGARMMIGKIRALTDKPIRFAFDTHHHGDHSYGNQIYVDNGAVPVAHTGALEEMRRAETGYFGHTPGPWEDSADVRTDMKATKLKPPSVLFPKELYFDDGKHRVELMHLGVAHTHGDAVAWLPDQKILFTGDVCVNGPYNFTGDGNVGEWIGTLDAAKKLGPKIVCTGHGPRSVSGVLEDQQAFFRAFQDLVGSTLREGSAEDVNAQIVSIRASLKRKPQIVRFATEPIGGTPDFFPANAHKIYEELTGKKLAALVSVPLWAREAHARSHGHQLV